MDWSLGFDVCFYGFKQAYPGDSQPMGLTIKDEFEPSTNVYSELTCSLTLCNDIRHVDANACSLDMFDQCRSLGGCRNAGQLQISLGPTCCKCLVYLLCVLSLPTLPVPMAKLR